MRFKRGRDPRNGRTLRVAFLTLQRSARKMGEILKISVHLCNRNRETAVGGAGPHFSRDSRAFISTISAVHSSSFKLGLRDAFSPATGAVFFFSPSLNPASCSIEFFHVTHDAAGRYIRPNKGTYNRFRNFQHRVATAARRVLCVNNKASQT